MKYFTYIGFALLVLTSCSGTKYFYRPNKNIQSVDGKVEKFFLQNKKNKKIAVTHIIPENGSNHISVLVIPPNGGNSSILAELMKPLINNNYSVYLFDYEGYGESEGKADNKNILTDAQIVLDYVEKNKQMSKLVVWGFSLGGNLAVKLTAENQEKIDALFIEAAFTSHRDIATAILPKGLKWLSCFIKSPYPAKKLIKNIHIPVFIAHSVSDKVCPFQMGEILYENANEPKCFLKLNGKHCYGLLEETEEYIRNLETFIKNNL
jgi:alpha-beta hydrolase superfamily lysophospholipase